MKPTVLVSSGVDEASCLRSAARGTIGVTRAVADTLLLSDSDTLGSAQLGTAAARVRRDFFGAGCNLAAGNRLECGLVVTGADRLLRRTDAVPELALEKLFDYAVFE